MQLYYYRLNYYGLSDSHNALKDSLDTVKRQRSEYLTPHVMASLIPPSLSDYLNVLISLKQTMDSRNISPTTARTGEGGTGVTTRGTETTAQPHAIKALALLDTGSLAGNFINNSTLLAINGTGRLYAASRPMLVCSGLDNHCTPSYDVIDILLSFDSDKIRHTINLTCRISPLSPVQIIIGRDSIKEHDLVRLLPRFFISTPEKITPPKSIKHGSLQTSCSILPSGCDASACTAVHHCGPYRGCSPSVHVDPLHHVPESSIRRVRFSDTPPTGQGSIATSPAPHDTPAQTWGLIATALRQNEQLLEAELIGYDEIDSDSKDLFAPFRPPEKSTSDLGENSFLTKITIEGDDKLRSAIKELCLKYKSIFSDVLSPHPASIPPFDLTVDKSKWENYRNRGPVRVQTLAKQQEIHKQVQEMIATGIIEKSNATYYSQVMLTPKPNGTFRFCADYRAMNDATDSASWPIPNIKQMLARLGAQKANTFGVMDLTAGYHQAPLTKSARVFTAFITFAGVYQFTRLPFGPKRAPSYFQEMMASIVLAGLIYMICEMYLDDCIVYGKGSDEFLTRLEQVFKRFKERNIFLKASKCKFGLSTVEYVGRQISKEGLTMSDTKISAVMNFPQPEVNTQLRSFLGVVNYFRDFVPDHSNVVSPLHQMINHSASKQTKLKWTSEGEQAFKAIKLLISKSPMLYFIHDTAPIVLMTDASDYGIGGDMYQTIDGQKQLVALVSKSLTATQLKWSVIQKEAYTIYYCCVFLDALLRDRKFTILTDHKNLTFLKQESNPMVVRWHLALQELDFDIQYVKGEDNQIADAMSRLCVNNKPTTLPSSLLSAIDGPYIISDDAYTNITLCHNSVIGHGGVERTLRKLKALHHNWQSMRLDVKAFIRECACCQKMTQIKVPITAYKYVTSTYRPMECLNIDFIGPYPDKGYVLTIVDTFTRWVELFATPEATAEQACICLVQHFGRYGSPSVIRSDRGSHFANAVIAQFLVATGTAQNLTLAYSSQENAIVERNNKEINRHLRALTFDKNTVDDYQLILPFVQRILNSSENERTNISPASLLFGNSINLDRGILLPFEEQPPLSQSLTKSTSKMLQIQHTLTVLARNVLKETDDVHLSLNSNAATDFLPGSFVLVAHRSAPETRLHTLWRGPMRVIRNTRGEYILFDLITNKEKRYHVSQLKQFNFNPARTDPLDVARKDYLEFFIEEVLYHTGQTDRISTLRFKIKWLGYDESYNSFEPWANLRDMEILHRYLIHNNLRKLIPGKFQENYRE